MTGLAEIAGVKVGMKVLEINGVKVSGRSKQELNTAVKDSPRKVSLTVQSSEHFVPRAQPVMPPSPSPDDDDNFLSLSDTPSTSLSFPRAMRETPNHQGVDALTLDTSMTLFKDSGHKVFYIYTSSFTKNSFATTLAQLVGRASVLVSPSSVGTSALLARCPLSRPSISN